MTTDETIRKEGSVLEEILEHVRSIDENVEEVLDRIGDHLDEARYHNGWGSYIRGDDNGYG